MRVDLRVAIFVASLTLAAPEAYSARIFTGRGDLNNDGNVNQVDVMMMENCLNGTGGGCGFGNPCIVNKTDLDGDDQLTLVDLSVLNGFVSNPSAHEPELQTDSATIYNYTTSAANNFHCRELFVEAYESLNFAPPQGFRRGDDLFCGDHYLAWIDNTGFHGELNGLWRLDGAALPEFVYGSGGLLRNLLVPAEGRNGQWPSGYSGAIHLEVLNRVPETAGPPATDDNPACASSWCNGYAVNEAGSFTRPTIPWWSACNSGSPGFDEEFPAIVNEQFATLSRRIVHEAAITKESDAADASYDGDSCHADYLFPDGIRRPMYVQLGWELYGQQAKIVQTVAVRNPNPSGSPLPGPGSGFILGFVLNGLQSPAPGKQFREYVMPVDDDASAECGNVTRYFAQGVFTHNGMYPICPEENVLDEGHDAHDWVVSVSNGFQIGKTVRAIAYRPDGLSIRSMQPCECYAHDGLELNVSLGQFADLQGGQTTGAYRFELTLY